jgi:SNF2 family DNA or RNA helicase
VRYKPRRYQKFTTDFIVDNENAGPLLDMGLGKTAATLAAISELYLRKAVKKVLVVAPKKVIENVWRQEATKWDEFNHLQFAMIHGTERQRKEAIKQPAHIWLVSRDNIAWLVSQFGSGWPFDMLVIDESSSFKNVKSGRFKALRTIRPLVKRGVILTGTPTPNGLLQLWPQIYILDRGKRLGESFAKYRQKYFTPSARLGEKVVSYELKGKRGYERGLGELLGEDFAQQEIYEKISDICYSMKSEDYIELPPFMDIEVPISLDPEVMKQYYEFEREQVLAIKDVTLTAVNVAALSNKLLQFASGAVYTDKEKNIWHEVHRAKLDAMEDILEEANGQSVLGVYWFRHSLERIQKHLKNYSPRILKSVKDFDAWNRGEIGFGLIHPMSGGHGLNLQDGGSNSAHYDNIWDLELVLQVNKRLHRPGQKKPVMNHRLKAIGTIDEDVIAAQIAKADGQNALLDAVKARIEKYS